MPQRRKLQSVPDVELFDPTVKTSELGRRYRVSRFVVYREKRRRLRQRDIVVVQRHQVRPEYLSQI